MSGTPGATSFSTSSASELRAPISATRCANPSSSPRNSAFPGSSTAATKSSSSRSWPASGVEPARARLRLPGRLHHERPHPLRERAAGGDVERPDAGQRLVEEPLLAGVGRRAGPAPVAAVLRPPSLAPLLPLARELGERGDPHAHVLAALRVVRGGRVQGMAGAGGQAAVELLRARRRPARVAARLVPGGEERVDVEGRVLDALRGDRSRELLPAADERQGARRRLGDRGLEAVETGECLAGEGRPGRFGRIGQPAAPVSRRGPPRRRRCDTRPAAPSARPARRAARRPPRGRRTRPAGRCAPGRPRRARAARAAAPARRSRRRPAGGR